jgi:hypothetical protein
MAQRRTKKELKKPPAVAEAEKKNEEEMPPTTFQQISSVFTQIAVMWVLSTLIMKALKYYNIAQDPEAETEAQ